MPRRAGKDHQRTQHVASKLAEIEAAMKSAPDSGARVPPRSELSDAASHDTAIHLLPPGAFLSDQSLQQHGVESYLLSAVEGLHEVQPFSGEMWVPVPYAAAHGHAVPAGLRHGEPRAAGLSAFPSASLTT